MEIMKIYAFCPVSDKKISEQVARLNGGFTVLLLIVFVLSLSIIPVIVLWFDFLMRASDNSKYSLIAITSKSIVRYAGLHEVRINAGPKIFAARLGFIFSSLIVVSLIFNAFLPALVLTGILGLFSFLEATFGLCVACEIYPFIYKFLYRVKFQ